MVASWVVVDGWSLNFSNPSTKEPVERSSLQFRVLTLKRFLPCIWRVLPVVGSSRSSDMGQGCANNYVCEEFFILFFTGLEKLLSSSISPKHREKGGQASLNDS